MKSWMSGLPPYTRELSRLYPGLFVILLDQSSSMGMEIEYEGRKMKKAEVVTRHVNTIIQEMIDNAGVEELNPGIRKKYAYLSVLGYDDDVVPLLSTVDTPVDIPTLARNPPWEVPEIHEILDRSGKVIRRFEEKKKVWIKLRTGVNTNMKLAFEHATDIVDTWLHAPEEEIAPGQGKQRPRNECFPPVVINVTDGYFNKGNPRSAVDALRRMGTSNGNVLVFNCHFTTGNSTERIFPKEVSEVQGLDSYNYAEHMFYLSSEIPEPLRPRAQKTMHTPIEAGARCVVYNAKLNTLVRFLRWGTVDISAATGTRG